MTIVQETRFTHDRQPYKVSVPLHLAGEATFNRFIAETLREYLHRQPNCRVHHVSDDELLRRVRHTFESHTARERV